jgi:tRNA pseudouridine38-40 synthase
MKDYQLIESLLKQKKLSNSDQQYFSDNPYYRSFDGVLSSDFSTLQELWNTRKIGKDVKIIEEKDHLIYYQMSIDHQFMVYGKIVFDQDVIKYLYETIKDKHMKRFFCVISYDGTLFEGYQKQVGKRTIQGVLEEALKNIFHEEVQIHASGRTDKGAHAYHQTLHFDVDTKIPIDSFQLVLKKYLPEDIVVKKVEEANPIFHARYDTVSKTYMYHIDYGEYDVTKRNYRLFVAKFDTNKFKKELLSIVGEHDFSSFTKTTKKDTIREIMDVNFEESSTDIKIWIKGNGFLRYMVRNLIVAAYLIATNELDISMEELLRLRDNTIIRHIASASGLYLYDVSYE